MCKGVKQAKDIITCTLEKYVEYNYCFKRMCETFGKRY